MGLAAILSVAAAPAAMAAEEVAVQEGQDITYQSYETFQGGTPNLRYGTIQIRRSSWDAFVEYYRAHLLDWERYFDSASGKYNYEVNLDLLTRDCFRDGYDTLVYKLAIEGGHKFKTTYGAAEGSYRETEAGVSWIDTLIFSSDLRIQENEYPVMNEFTVIQGLSRQEFAPGFNFSLSFNGVNYADCYLGTKKLTNPNVTYIFLRVPHGYQEDTISWTLRSKYYATPEDAASGRVSEKNYTYHFLGGSTAQTAEDGWQQSDDGRWWVKAGDGWLHDQWYTDGGKEYYLDSEGYMMRDADTPDGGRVGADGVRIR